MYQDFILNLEKTKYYKAGSMILLILNFKSVFEIDSFHKKNVTNNYILQKMTHATLKITHNPKGVGCLFLLLTRTIRQLWQKKKKKKTRMASIL